jgi:hypothetical protein
MENLRIDPSPLIKDIYWLRKNAFIKREGFPIEDQMVCNPLDSISKHFLVYKKGKLLGCVSYINFELISPLELENFLPKDLHERNPKKISQITKLAMDENSNPATLISLIRSVNLELEKEEERILLE